ncbi:response regulator [Caldicellulosiruptor changbaiensis]|nr:hypothetical protein [Caldicellulosiruptor changbaiensis]
MIVDDDNLILDGLRVILELEGFDVVELAKNAKKHMRYADCKNLMWF